MKPCFWSISINSITRLRYPGSVWFGMLIMLTVYLMLRILVALSGGEISWSWWINIGRFQMYSLVKEILSCSGRIPETLGASLNPFLQDIQGYILMCWIRRHQLQRFMGCKIYCLYFICLCQSRHMRNSRTFLLKWCWVHYIWMRTNGFTVGALNTLQQNITSININT